MQSASGSVVQRQAVIGRTALIVAAHGKEARGSALGLSALLIVTAVGIACSPAMYRRDVTAVVEGPASIGVGESTQLRARLEFSDGSVRVTQPTANESVDWESSNPGVATVVSIAGRERNAGRVTAVAPGQVTITATPSVMTTGSGQRIAGTLRITVIE